MARAEHYDERQPLLSKPRTFGSTSSGSSAGSSSPPPDFKLLNGQPVEQQALQEALRAPVHLPLRQKWFILGGIMLASFVKAADMHITAVLVAPMASSFHASQEAGLVATSFLLTNIACTPLYGRLSTILGRRTANAISIGLFAVGTGMCVIAPSMEWLLLARFIAGAGGGGITITASVIASDIFPLSQRGLVGALSTAIGAVGSAVGGPLGGFVADRWGWRMAFSAQMPMLLISMAIGLKYIDYSVASANKETWRAKVGRIDLLGSLLILLSIATVTSLISLKNIERLPWADVRVATSAVLAPIFVGSFLLVEAHIAKEPILDFRLLKSRVPLTCVLLALFVAVCNWGVTYSLPLHFLGVRGTTIAEAGAHLIPAQVGQVLGSFTGGLLLHKTGKYRTGNIIVGTFSSIAVLAMAHLKVDSGPIQSWLDILPMGTAFGFTLNTSSVALMAAIPHADIATMQGVLWLFRTTGQVMGVATTSAIFQNFLASALAKRIQGPDAKEIIRVIREDSNRIPEFPAEIVRAARESYGVALKPVFLFCASSAFLAWVAVSFVPQLDIRRKTSKAKTTRSDDDTEAQSAGIGG